MREEERKRHEHMLNRIQRCELCPRLVAYRSRVARERRRAYRDCEYWGKPVPSFGDVDVQLLLIGLAAPGGRVTSTMPEYVMPLIPTM